MVTGGGTAGHVHPGLALAHELAQRGWTVSWVGRPGSLEQALVVRAGLEFDAVVAAPLVGRGLVGRVRGLLTGLRGAFSARSVLRRRQPQAVVGTGGFVSFPAVAAAWSRRIPVLLFEPNATMGVANRVLGRLASRVAWGQGEASDPARVVTGVPVDAAFQHRPIADGEEGRINILVLGGSQGSQQLNQVVPAALAILGAQGCGPIRLVHQCGRGNADTTRRNYAAVDADAEVMVVEFMDDVAMQMASADVVVSRAGAQTLAELAAVGRPAVLIPLGLAHGHQAVNAAALAAEGAAWSLTESESEPLEVQLAQRLAVLCADRALIEQAAQRMSSRATPAAAERLADEVINLTEAA